MFNSFKLNNIKYSLIKIKELINTYKIPQCQRTILANRVQHLDNHIIFKFNPITPLYFVLFNNNRYIIDGLHRMEVYKKYNYLLEEKIPIVEIHASTLTELNNYFTLINDNMQLHDIYKNNDIEMEDVELSENHQLIKKNIIIETHNHFIKNYPNSFKYNGKRRPFLDNNKFMDQLLYIYENVSNLEISPIKSSDNFIKLLNKLNDKYKLQNIDWYPSKGKTQNKDLIDTIKSQNCLYFGMIPNDWFNHVKNIPQLNSENKISQSLRQQIWFKYSNNKLNIKCICCNLNEINSFNFECGHIDPKSKGGLCNINNLVPICSLCNKSMGNTNMKIFMKNNNYSNPLLQI
jgi:hypothetical protein